jgi:hypothetical protein
MNRRKDFIRTSENKLACKVIRILNATEKDTVQINKAEVEQWLDFCKDLCHNRN